jgi:CheY-like chemotaxis protein
MPVPPLRILVLDDEMEVAQVAADMLAVDGHTVETETSPRRAIERLVERHFDVLLTDVRMPGMSGIEVSEALPWAAGNPHVIFMTGDMLTAETTAALQRMGAVTIGKPFHPQELRQALAQVLGGAA